MVYRQSQEGCEVSTLDKHGKYGHHECWIGGEHCATLRQGAILLRRLAVQRGIPELDVTYWTLVNGLRHGKRELWGITISTTAPEQTHVQDRPGHRIGEPLLDNPCTHRLGANATRFE